MSNKSKVKRDSYVGFRLPKILYEWVQGKTKDELKTLSEFMNQMVKSEYDKDKVDEDEK